MSAEREVDEENLEELYNWVDKTPLTRPKKNIARDFADGLLVAEIVNFHIPSLVELHNYPSVNNAKQKMANWVTLNRKVFKKLGFEITDEVIDQIIAGKPFAIELFLMKLRDKIERYNYEKQRQKPKPGPVHQNNDYAQEPDMGFAKQSHSPVREYISGGRNADHGQASPGRGAGGGNVRKGDSLNNLHRVGPGPTNYDYRRPQGGGGGGAAKGALRGGEMVPKIAVEEKEQEILAKEETIQILQAKIRRMEHLLHLKDLRIGDLQSQMESVNKKLRPTNNVRR